MTQVPSWDYYYRLIKVDASSSILPLAEILNNCQFNRINVRLIDSFDNFQHARINNFMTEHGLTDMNPDFETDKDDILWQKMLLILKYKLHLKFLIGLATKKLHNSVDILGGFVNVLELDYTDVPENQKRNILTGVWKRFIELEVEQREEAIEITDERKEETVDDNNASGSGGNTRTNLEALNIDEISAQNEADLVNAREMINQSRRQIEWIGQTDENGIALDADESENQDFSDIEMEVTDPFGVESDITLNTDTTEYGQESIEADTIRGVELQGLFGAADDEHEESIDDDSTETGSDDDNGYEAEYEYEEGADDDESNFENEEQERGEVESVEDFVEDALEQVSENQDVLDTDVATESDNPSVNGSVVSDEPTYSCRSWW